MEIGGTSLESWAMILEIIGIFDRNLWQSLEMVRTSLEIFGNVLK